MSNPAEAVTTAIEEQLGGWRPGQGMELYAMLMALPGLFDALHDALGGVVDAVSEEQGLPGWFTASAEQLLKSVAAARDQAAQVDEEFHKAYSFFLTTDEGKKRRRRR